MFCEKTHPNKRRYGVAFFVGIIGGILSGMIKSGSEGLLPPRTPDRIAPPIDMLKGVGIDPSHYSYNFSQHVIHYAGAGVHYLFSIAFAVVYCVLAEIYPKTKLWQGMLFGLVVAVGFHGIVLPVLQLSPAPWNLPTDEIISEIIGTALWAWTIEIVRRDLRNRITGQLDPEKS